MSTVGIVALALLIAAALFLMYEIGRLVGEKTTADKFPEAKKAAVQRSRSVLSGMFAEQLAPYLPDFPFSPTEAKFIGAPIDFLVFKGMDAQHIEEIKAFYLCSARVFLEIATFPIKIRSHATVKS